MRIVYRKGRRARHLLPVSVALLTAAACYGELGGSSEASSKGSKKVTTIDIGALLPLTGSASAYGPGMRVAVQTAVNEVNAAGGPIKFKLHIEDDATDPNTGVLAAHRLIDVDHVKAIIGPWASAVTLAVAPIVEAANIVDMNVSGAPALSTLQPAGKRTIFRVNAVNTSQAAAVAKVLLAEGKKTTTIITNNNSGTLPLGDGFKTAFTKDGGQVLQTIAYPDLQSDYTSQVDSALATKPDFYFLACYTPDGSLILKEAAEAGVQGKFVVTASCLNQQMIDTVGGSILNGDTAFDVVPNPKSPAFKRLNAAYQKSLHTDAFTNAYASHAYDAVQLLALAFQKSGDKSALAVGKSITRLSNPPGHVVSSYAQGWKALARGKSIHYSGASGPIEFDSHGDMAPTMGIFTVKNGSIVLQKTHAGV